MNFDLGRARALVDSEGKVRVYLDGDRVKEPDLIVGMVDEEGRFVPFREEYRALETWLRAEERLFIEEGEAESFQLYLPEEREFVFAYGPEWRDV